MKSFLKKQKKSTLIAVIALIISIVYGIITDTLTYPWIMLDRQVELLTHCYFGEKSNTLSAPTYNFSATVGEKECVLPHRLFPDDGSMQVVPRGLYGVFNEYAKGTIINASQSTLLFEPLTPERNTKNLIATLKRGGFMGKATIKEYKNKNGLSVTEISNVNSLDPGTLFDWAFIDNPNGKSMVSILVQQPKDKTVFYSLINSMNTLK